MVDEGAGDEDERAAGGGPAIAQLPILSARGAVARVEPTGQQERLAPERQIARATIGADASRMPAARASDVELQAGCRTTRQAANGATAAAGTSTPPAGVTTISSIAPASSCRAR